LVKISVLGAYPVSALELSIHISAWAGFVVIVSLLVPEARGVGVAIGVGEAVGIGVGVGVGVLVGVGVAVGVGVGVGVAPLVLV